jgi:DNA-directed RNA polymerase subunit RPC12/RpoP
LIFVAKYRCSDCNHEFERKTEHDPRKRGRTPSCPECKKNKHPTVKSVSKSNVEYTQEKLDTNFQQMIQSGKTPSLHGTNNFNKALDLTAKICMEDQNMTDINIGSNLRQGDSCAPKLSHELERKVDEVFKPQKPIMGQQGAGTLNKALTAQINSGRYAGQTQIRDIAAQAQSYGQERTARTGNKVPMSEIFNYDNRNKPN